MTFLGQKSVKNGQLYHFFRFSKIFRQASKKFYNKCSENSRSQIVLRTVIFQKLTLGASEYGSKIELLNNPLYLKAFLYPRILENTCLSAQKKIEEIYVLKSASFFVIDCDFRFQQVLLSFYNLNALTS